jgi:hypothetical protein
MLVVNANAVVVGCKWYCRYGSILSETTRVSDAPAVNHRENEDMAYYIAGKNDNL